MNMSGRERNELLEIIEELREHEFELTKKLHGAK